MKTLVSLVTVALTTLIAFPQTIAVAGDKECDALMKQIDDGVDKVARVSERMGMVEQWIDEGRVETNKLTLEKDKSTLRKTKLQIANTAEKLCSCCAKRSGKKERDKECDALLKQIDDLVDKVARVSQRMGTVQQWIDEGRVETNKATLETDKSTLRKTKLKIANLAEELCACCGKKAETTSKPSPTPTPKTIGRTTEPIVEINPPTEPVTQPLELAFGYNYIHAPGEDVKNLHGLETSLFYNFNGWFALGGEFMAGWGEESFDGFDVSLDRYAYLFGPRVSVHPTPRVRLFAEALFGGVHDSTDVTSRNVVFRSGSYSANAFAIEFGGGAEWQFAEHWSWRIVQADYLATRFGGTWQDNWRFSTSLVFHFGGKKPEPSLPSARTYDSKGAVSDAK